MQEREHPGVSPKDEASSGTMRSTQVPYTDSERRPLASPLAHRLLSLSGVFPLGAFLVLHLAVNTLALRREAAYVAAVGAVHRLPGIIAGEWVLVLAPLLVHASIGMWLVGTRQSLVKQGPYPLRLRIAMRATGVAAFAFLAMHLLEVRFGRSNERLGGAELMTVLDAGLSSIWHGVPWRGAAYLAGTACVTFHFATGLWGYAVGTRLGHSERVRRQAGWGAAALGAVIWLLLANVVVFHATGARLFGGPAEPERSGSSPCPARD